MQVRCLVSSSVFVQDLGVRLSGRGDRATVLFSSASASADLRREIRDRRVEIGNIGDPGMRLWPLSRRIDLPPTPSADPPPEGPTARPADPELLRVLRSIDEKLSDLLRRPEAPSPEVVASHVAAVTSAVVSSASPAPTLDSHPKFIPSTIMPDGAVSGDIKVRTKDVDVDVGDSVDALKNLRKGKPR